MEIEGEIQNAIHVWSAKLACLCYCYFVSAKLPKGKWRLISLLPIFSIFIILPLLLTTSFITFIAACFITWITNFKLLLFAFDRGPLSSKPTKSLPVFLATAGFAFRVKRRKNDSKKSTILPVFLAAEIPFTAVLISLLFNYKQYIHPIIALLAFYTLVFLLVEVLIGLSNLLVGSLLRVELDPPSDEPYLSTSLSEFWGRRWNLTYASVLRETVYETVSSAARAAVGRDLAAVVGVFTTFLVSGLMHEMVLWYSSGSTPSWEMTMFFVVHGVCVVMENVAKMAMAKKKWRLPWYVSGPLTLGFVMWTSNWLFFGAVKSSGMIGKLIEEFRYLGLVVENKFSEYISI